VKNLNEKKDGLGPRKIALLILNRYFKTKKSLKDIINHYLGHYRLSGLDRRFIFNIAKGTVRYFLKIDFILSLFSDKKIKDIDFAVLNILRMGVYQHVYMDKVPSYSAVDECVKLAKKEVSLPASKFVNAVMRRVSSVSDLKSLLEEKLTKSVKKDTDKIGIRYSYPGWLVKYWLDRYGRKKTILICSSLNENPHVYLKFNKEKISKKELGKEMDIVPPKDNLLLDNMLESAVEVSSVQDISETDIYKKGLVSVQDLSSQMAVEYFLKPLKNEKVLDVCAAPGGKTAYIAELVGNGGEVFSVDISREKLKILKSNLERLNIRNVRVMEADAKEQDFIEKSQDMGGKGNSKSKDMQDGYAGYFDKILIDAPCSAFGTISKNPDVKYNKSMDDIIRLSKESYRMMVSCERYLKAGGRLVFYTCTLSPLESQQVIGRFLEYFKKKYAIEKLDVPDKLISALDLMKDNINTDKGTCMEIMPYYFKSESGFICSLIKISSAT